jgi:hypothetical protein
VVSFHWRNDLPPKINPGAIGAFRSSPQPMLPFYNLSFCESALLLEASRSVYRGESFVKIFLMTGTRKRDDYAAIENTKSFADEPGFQNSAHILFDQNQRC